MDDSPRVLVGGTVIQFGADPIEDAVVVLEGDRIAAVGPRSSTSIPEGATEVNISGRFVMPGLVDGHVHFFQSGGLYTRPDVIDLRSVRSHEDEIAGIKERLPDTFRRYIMSGVTSAVDVGGPMWNLNVRDQADTSAVAPNVVVAGPLISSVARPQLGEEDPPILQIETPGGRSRRSSATG